MLTRNDIQGEERAPQSITDYLLRKAGKNLYGEPNFRLVWSRTRMRQSAGVFNDWDPNVAPEDRGKLVRTAAGILIPNDTPRRTVVETRTVRKYPFAAGWVLERWIPAAYYGARGDWEDRCIPGTAIPSGGPYPLHGDYEMCHNSASAEIPSISELATAIDRCEKARENHQSHTQQALLERHNADVQEYEKEQQKQKEQDEAFVREIMRTNYSNSLQMGAWRTRMAEKLGIREHVGN